MTGILCPFARYEPVAKQPPADRANERNKNDAENSLGKKIEKSIVRKIEKIVNFHRIASYRKYNIPRIIVA